MTHTQKSYATFGLSRSLWQLQHAWKMRKHADENMTILFRMLRQHEQRMEHKLKRPLQNLRILEIGPGQGMERARYFGLKNEVAGLDLDVIPQGLDVQGYWQMVKKNGFGRFLKTTGRKLVVGRVNAAAWARAVGSKAMHPPRLLHGDICQSVPETNAFDVVMSWSVFEHLPDPVAALTNVIKSLRPGGIFYLSLHLFTSHNGHHDIRAFTGHEDELPLWGHLRPSASHLIHPSAYLNQWRLVQWRELFSRLTPGAEEFLESYNCHEEFGPRISPELRQELATYSDEELYTVDAIYLWQKPPQDNG